MRRLSRITPLRSVRIKGVYGQTILDMHQQLTRILDKRQYGLGHVLAEPSVNTARGEILWYTRAEGEIRAFTSLSDDEKVAIQESLSTERDRIEAIAEGLKNTNQKERIADADGFLRALTLDALPVEALFLVGDQVVVTDWGCEQVDRSIPCVSLTAAAAPLPEPAPPPPAPPPPVPPVAEPAPIGWWRWLRWLLLLLLLLFLLTFLVRGCVPVGLNAQLPTLGGLLPAPPAPPSPQLMAEEQALRDEVQDLGRGLVEKAQTCAVPSTDERLAREGGEKGDINVSLTWNNYNDLDLIIETPDGQRISYENKTDTSGGALDIDMNAGNDNRDQSPIENIRWANGAPPGEYKVYVLLYDIAPESNSQPFTPYTVTVTVHGQEQIHSGRITRNQRRQPVLVTTFTVP